MREYILERIVPSGALKDEIDKLIEQKSMGAELDYGNRIPIISEFIESELSRLEEDQKQYVNNPARACLLVLRGVVKCRRVDSV
jgi:predicted nucleotidyltransferase